MTLSSKVPKNIKVKEAGAAWTMTPRKPCYALKKQNRYPAVTTCSTTALQEPCAEPQPPTEPSPEPPESVRKGREQIW